MTKLEQIRALKEKRAAKTSRGERAPKPPGAALPVSTETASDKGKAENGPAARRRSVKPVALATDKGTTQREDRASPARPRETKPKKPKAAKKRAKKPAPAVAKVKVGRPRAEDRGKTLSDTKPWLAAKMSRASWYRQRRSRERS